MEYQTFSLSKTGTMGTSPSGGTLVMTSTVKTVSTSSATFFKTSIAFGKVLQFAFTLDDRRGCLFPEHIIPEFSGGLIGHEMGDGVFHGKLVTDSCGHQGHGDLLDIPEVSPDAGASKLLDA